MLRASGVTVRFGGLTAVNQLDLEVSERGVHVLAGPNGAGKTTLLNALTRVCPVSGGRIEFAGIDLLRLAPHAVIGQGIARSFQRAELFWGLSVFDNVAVGLHAQMHTGLDGAVRSPRTRAEERWANGRVRTTLQELELWALRDRAPADLPYGVQKLLDVARALVSQPRLLLLDEPYAGLSESEVPRLTQCIVNAGQRCAVLMIEHHLDVVLRFAERVTVMNFGRKIAEGTPAAVRADPEVVRCYLGTGRRQAAC